ncbi:MAG: pentapeptide repeat-containing protein [Planctomycetaceae bacterium]|jgi:uncharacterized protein YjbI with pentapeptide repeats|nr:pentapeptide repeat-containing protein [Planctomycetaceae bacterium]
MKIRIFFGIDFLRLWSLFFVFAIMCLSGNISFAQTILQLHSIDGKTFILQDNQIIVDQIFGSQSVNYDFLNPESCVGNGKYNGINFSKSRFYGVRFTDVTFDNCLFNEIILHRCTLDGNFQNCDFTDSVLHYGGRNFSKLANSFEPDLLGVTTLSLVLPFSVENLKQTKSFKEKNLSGVDLKIAQGEAIDFSGFDLSFAGLREVSAQCRFDNAFLFNTYLSTINKEQLYSTESYKNGTINYVEFAGGNFSNVNFVKFNLTGCEFPFVDLRAADFTGAVITDCNFEKAKNLTAEQIKSTWNYKSRRMDDIKLPIELQPQFDNK